MGAAGLPFSPEVDGIERWYDGERKRPWEIMWTGQMWFVGEEGGGEER